MEVFGDPLHFQLRSEGVRGRESGLDPNSGSVLDRAEVTWRCP
jgi:hypothetical protein